MDLLSYLVSTRVASDVAALVFLKGTVLVLVLALSSRLLRSRSAATRHSVWVGGLLALLALPLLAPLLPQWRAFSLPYPTETMLLGTEALETASAPALELPRLTSDLVAWWPDGLALSSVLLLIWWIGTLALGIGVIGDHVRARHLVARSRRLPDHDPLHALLEAERRRLGIRRRVGLFVAPRPGIAATLGIFRPRIVVGRDVAGMPHETLRSLFIHELAHIRRGDYFTFLLATLVQPLYWPNPLVWWARRRTADECERACDDEVINGGIAPPAYARVLLEFALARDRAAQPDVAWMAFSSSKSRIGSILDGSRDRRRLGAVAGLVVPAVLAGFAIPMASLQVMASAPGTGTRGELVSALHHADAAIRAQAVRTLGRRDASTSRVELEAMLDDPVADVRLAAIAGLEQLGDPASIPAMAHVLQRPFDGGRGEHGFVLKFAVLALGRIGTPEAAQVLEGQLDRPVPELRWLALKTMLSMPGQQSRARPYLKQFAQADASPFVRQQACDALTALGPADSR